MPSQPNWAKEMQVDIQDHSSKLIDDLKQEIHDEFTAKFRQQSARENSLLNERMLHMECVSMSSNLIISGLPEPSSEAEYDLYQTLITFFEEVLLIDDAQDMLIARCHRLSRHQGPFNKDRPRDVVVRFTHYPDRMKVLRGAKNLNEQFPAEINRRRKMLRPILKEARKRGLRANLTRDKLFIDGKSFTVNDINNIPFPTDEIATITTDTHVFFSSVLSPFSCQFTVDDVDYCSVEQYYQSAKAAFANDAAAEAHIMSVSDPVDMLRAGKLVDIDHAAWADEE